MFKKNKIKDQCQKIKKSFFQALQHEPMNACYMLGGLFLVSKDATTEETTLLTETLDTIKQKITPSEIKMMWQCVSTLSSTQLKLMHKDSLKLLQVLQQQLLRDTFFMGNIEKRQIISLGQNRQWYREALLALIRCHLLINRNKDPFLAPHFSFELLEQSGAEHNFLYVSSYVRKCTSLPLNDIAALGKNPKIAKYILRDLTDSPSYFEISSIFVKQHSCLRAPIAQHWKGYFETFPLSTQQKNFVKKELSELKQRYPEFKDLDLHARFKRNYQYEKTASTALFDTICFSVSAPIGAYLIPNIYTHAASVVTLASSIACGNGAAAALTCCSTAVPVLLPLAALWGISYIAEKSFKQVAQKPKSPDCSSSQLRP